MLSNREAWIVLGSVIGVLTIIMLLLRFIEHILPASLLPAPALCAPKRSTEPPRYLQPFISENQKQQRFVIPDLRRLYQFTDHVRPQ